MRTSGTFITLCFLGLWIAGCDDPAAADQGKNHRVEAGETLFAIAERTYGNGLEWPRIWEANPWVDPDRLRTGEIIHVPAKDKSWSNPPPQPRATGRGPRFYADTGDVETAIVESDSETSRMSANPGGNPGVQVFHNLKTNVSQKTVFGFTLDKAMLILVTCFLLHALLQSTLVWLGAHLTFVKEASFKKSMKAVFLTEMLTFATIFVLGVVAILLLYSTVQPAGESAGGQLFPSFETFLRTRTGLGVAALVIMLLYITLSLRFLPQVFSVPMSHAITLMALAILVPHLVGIYLVGQRAGIIH